MIVKLLICKLNWDHSPLIDIMSCDFKKAVLDYIER